MTVEDIVVGLITVRGMVAAGEAVGQLERCQGSWQGWPGSWQGGRAVGEVEADQGSWRGGRAVGGPYTPASCIPQRGCSLGVGGKMKFTRFDEVGCQV